jgi:hypothetical protein
MGYAFLVVARCDVKGCLTPPQPTEGHVVKGQSIAKPPPGWKVVKPKIISPGSAPPRLMCDHHVAEIERAAYADAGVIVGPNTDAGKAR